MTVKEFLDQRVAAHASITKSLLLDKGDEVKILSNEATDIALKGYDPSTNRALYSAPILMQMGMPESEMTNEESPVGFIQPAIIPFDEIMMSVWHWQTSLDEQASVEGLLDHLQEELNELREVVERREDTPKSRHEIGSEMADVFIIALHLAALLSTDPTAAIASKLSEIRTRNYELQEDGKVKHTEG
jgi:NTP pyrophosphatase (non-canonical NTP hydrolase)